MNHKNFEGVGIRIRPNEEPDRWIKRFSKVVRESKILDEYREGLSYEKPSVKRRRKSAIARWKRSLEE